jgi:hypothetical protein
VGLSIAGNRVVEVAYPGNMNMFSSRRVGQHLGVAA